MRNVAPLLAGSIGLSGCGSDPETAGGSGGGSAAVPDAPSAGQVLFEDVFDHDRNGWALPENESGRTATSRRATSSGRAGSRPADTDADFQWYEFVARDGYAAIRLADSEGSLDVLATTEDLELPSGEQFTVEAACVDDDQGQAQLWLTVNDTLVLHTTQSDPLGNGVAVLQAYDAPESASDDCFVIRWHDFSVLQPGNGPWMLGAAGTSVASAVTTAARRCSGTIGGRKVELCGKALPDDVLLTVQAIHSHSRLPDPDVFGDPVTEDQPVTGRPASVRARADEGAVRTSPADAVARRPGRCRNPGHPGIVRAAYRAGTGALK